MAWHLRKWTSSIHGSWLVSKEEARVNQFMWCFNVLYQSRMMGLCENHTQTVNRWAVEDIFCARFTSRPFFGFWSWLVNLPPLLTYPPQKWGLMIRAYENPLVSLNKAGYYTLISGGCTLGGGRLTSHDHWTNPPPNKKTQVGGWTRQNKQNTLQGGHLPVTNGVITSVSTVLTCSNPSYPLIFGHLWGYRGYPCRSIYIYIYIYITIGSGPTLHPMTWWSRCFLWSHETFGTYRQ